MATQSEVRTVKDRVLFLQRRARLTQKIRDIFAEHGYWEVETPLLSKDTCIDQWIDPISFDLNEVRHYLQTSPEFAMKRLLCEGFDSIFQICKAFRSGETGEKHNPEFTMLEWYRCDVTVADQMAFVEAIITELTTFAVTQEWIPESTMELSFHYIMYDEAFRQFAKISALEATIEEMHRVAIQAGWNKNDLRSCTSRDDYLNYVLAQMVEPRLAEMGAVFLHSYPASQSALARIDPADSRIAERFELYLHGVEICNGYQELTDPDELRERMATQNEKRRRVEKSKLPVESQLLTAMHKDGLRECSGVALGWDRLVMYCLGLEQLPDAVTFPFEIA